MFSKAKKVKVRLLNIKEKKTDKPVLVSVTTKVRFFLQMPSLID